MKVLESSPFHCSGLFHLGLPSGFALGGMILAALLFVSELCPVAVFAQNDASSQEQYRIGPEDVLSIHVWREEALTRTVPVRLDGKISLPLLDEIQASGLTPLELKQTITEKLREYMDDPIVTVIVSEHNHFKVFVSGQVRTPGMFRLRSKSTLLQVIPLAGGFTEWADPKKIMVIRKEKGREEKSIVNYKKLLESGSDIDLQPGDVIVVP